MRRAVCLALLMWLPVSCQATAQTGASPGGMSTADFAARAAITPVADHHHHLLGPTARQTPPAELAAVEVPAEVRALLDERARLYATATEANLSAAFTPDAQVVSWGRPSRWIRGPEAVLGALNGVVRQIYEFVPNAWGAEGDAGFVAGTVRVGETHALDFLLGLKRNATGGWSIAAESVTIKTPPFHTTVLTAERFLSDLDQAGLERAIFLSAAFWMGSRFPDPADEMTAEYDAVRAENDWTAAQVAQYPDRMLMACSASVLRAYASKELLRCRQYPQARAFKLHFADADVNLVDPAHLERIRTVFRTANEARVPLIIHMAPRRNYGPAEVDMLLDLIAATAPDIPIQIAHLAGDGPGLTSPDALGAFAEARAARDPRTRNLWFDIAGLVTERMGRDEAELMVRRMRQIGLDRVLYASDGSPPNASTGQHWYQVRTRLPLTNDELRTLATNVAPWMR